MLIFFYYINADRVARTMQLQSFQNVIISEKKWHKTHSNTHTGGALKADQMNWNWNESVEYQPLLPTESLRMLCIVGFPSFTQHMKKKWVYYWWRRWIMAFSYRNRIKDRICRSWKWVDSWNNAILLYVRVDVWPQAISIRLKEHFQWRNLWKFKNDKPHAKHQQKPNWSTMKIEMA